jgi:hypothetical protein
MGLCEGPGQGPGMGRALTWAGSSCRWPVVVIASTSAATRPPRAAIAAMMTMCAEPAARSPRSPTQPGAGALAGTRRSRVCMHCTQIT